MDNYAYIRGMSLRTTLSREHCWSLTQAKTNMCLSTRSKWLLYSVRILSSLVERYRYMSLMSSALCRQSTATLFAALGL